MIVKSSISSRSWIPFHTMEDLRDLLARLGNDLTRAKAVPEFPPVDFKPNLALIRDLELEIEYVSGVIMARETIAI